jgi:hypothetical protein
LTFLIVLNLTREMTPYGRFQLFGISLICFAIIFLFLIREPRFKEKRSLRGFEDFENKSKYEKARDLTK